MTDMPEEIQVSALLATNKLGMQMCTIKKTKKTLVPYLLKSTVDAQMAEMKENYEYLDCGKECSRMLHKSIERQATIEGLDAQRAADDKTIKELAAALEDAIELLELADYKGVRAEAFKDQNLPEDPLIKQICEQRGYGAVMDSACRQWFLKAKEIKLPGSNHTSGACAASIQRFMDKHEQALKTHEPRITEAQDNIK